MKNLNANLPKLVENIYPDDVFDFTETDTEFCLKYAEQILNQSKEVLDKVIKLANAY